jgi:predicted dehydrogenase
VIRLALIGQAKAAESYGAIRTRLHRAAWAAFAPLTVSDGQAGQALGQAMTAASPESLFAEHANDFDAVVIEAGPGQAASLAKAAAAIGKPALAGPLPADIAALGQADTLLMPAHAWRFLPSIQAVKRSLDAGKLGEPGLLRIHRWLPPGAPPESLTERILPDADLACWMFGGAPEKVWTLQPAANPDYIQFHLGFANDGMAMIDVAGSLPAGGDYFSLSMIGSTGAAYADDHHNMNLLYSGGQPSALRASQGRADLAGQLQEFVDAIGEQRPAAVTLEDATRTIAVTEQIIESANSSQVIERKEGS